MATSRCHSGCWDPAALELCSAPPFCRGSHSTVPASSPQPLFMSLSHLLPPVNPGTPNPVAHSNPGHPSLSGGHQVSCQPFVALRLPFIGCPCSPPEWGQPKTPRGMRQSPHPQSLSQLLENRPHVCEPTELPEQVVSRAPGGGDLWLDPLPVVGAPGSGTLQVPAEASQTAVPGVP